MAAAAIIAAVLSAAAQGYSSDQANTNELIGAAGQKPKPQPPPYEPTAARFAPGVSGTGDGSMPVKADAPGLGMQPQLEGQVAGPVSSAFSPGNSAFSQPDQGSTSSLTQASKTQPSQPQPDTTTTQTIGNAAQLAQTGVGIAQALQGQPLQPMQPAQVGGQGYSPTAIQVLEMLAQRKRALGY